MVSYFGHLQNNLFNELQLKECGHFPASYSSRIQFSRRLKLGIHILSLISALRYMQHIILTYQSHPTKLMSEIVVSLDQLDTDHVHVICFFKVSEAVSQLNCCSSTFDL